MKVAILAGGIGERLTRYCDRLRYTERFKYVFVDISSSMKGGLLGNYDIELYLTREELFDLQNKKKFEVRLEDVHHIGTKRKLTLTYEDFPSLGDGIKTEIIRRKDNFSYIVKINYRALQEITNNGSWGSRYGDAGILVSTGKPPWERPKI